MENLINQYLKEVRIISEIINTSVIEDFISKLKNIKEGDGRVFVAGVGGSAANASHFVNDLRKILEIETYSISENVSELTARINDESWETSYLNFLKISKFSDKDCLIVLSVGGGTDYVSLNLVRCLEHARGIGSTILSIVSRDGCKSKELSDCCILIPIVDDKRITPHAEEWQIILLHLIVIVFQK
jgi:D-sedoheptulose 7-phosphate isomerase